jgi:hypothetical protein
MVVHVDGLPFMGILKLPLNTTPKAASAKSAAANKVNTFFICFFVFKSITNLTLITNYE